MDGYQVYDGYGFPTKGITAGHIRKFIAEHADSLHAFCRTELDRINTGSLVHLAVNGNITDEEFEDMAEVLGFIVEEKDRHGPRTLCNTVADIMSVESKMPFEYVTGDVECGEEAAIMIVSGFPWTFLGRLKEMSVSDVDAVMQRYIDELGIGEEPSYLTVMEKNRN